MLARHYTLVRSLPLLPFSSLPFPTLFFLSLLFWFRFVSHANAQQAARREGRGDVPGAVDEVLDFASELAASVNDGNFWCCVLTQRRLGDLLRLQLRAAAAAAAEGGGGGGAGLDTLQQRAAHCYDKATAVVRGLPGAAVVVVVVVAAAAAAAAAPRSSSAHQLSCVLVPCLHPSPSHLDLFFSSHPSPSPARRPPPALSPSLPATHTQTHEHTTHRPKSSWAWTTRRRFAARPLGLASMPMSPSTAGLAPSRPTAAASASPPPSLPTAAAALA